jgi:hypothetical protein
MLFKYPLTDDQYNRFQHPTNDAEIELICNKVGIQVTDQQIVAGRETWYFKGRCSGTMALVHLPAVLWAEDPALRLPRWECWIQIRKKPWWLPWFILDRGFKEALE